MLIIEINQKTYNLPLNWTEITIKETAELHVVVKSIPVCLKNSYFKKQKLKVADIENECIPFYKSIIKQLTKCEDLDKTNTCDIIAIYKRFCEWMVKDLLGQPEAFLEIESFDFDGETFLIPESKVIMNEIRIGHKLSTIQFTECADLIKYSETIPEGIPGIISNVMSILCLKKDEMYIEEVSLLRAEKFKQLPMSTGYSVFFSFIKSMNKFLEDLKTLTNIQELEAKLLQKNPV